MKKKIVLVATILIAVARLVWYRYLYEPPIETKFSQRKTNQTRRSNNNSSDQSVFDNNSNENIKQPGDYALVDIPNHTYQTFNNCGPATLSMMLSFYGESVTQETLGNAMRPYQNPQGDNDDKTIFSYEFVDWAEEYNLKALERINGDIELLKQFTANGIPVVVKTWLHPNDDVGHFRIVRGFDENADVVIQDDSYEGPNRRISYYDFLSMWQPFNYNYIVIYEPNMQDTVEAIIGDEIDKKTAWQNALNRAQEENKLNPKNPYPEFNMSTSYYHLGEYERSVEYFERVQDELPRRMLWYQIEPIRAYRELGEYEKVFEISNNILNNGNRAFSELYQMMGEIYYEQGNLDLAKENFELALQYNKNYDPANEYLNKLQ